MSDRGPLSSREKEIVALVALGFSNRRVASRLFIAEGTVKTHLHNVFGKLGLRSRVTLVLYAVRAGLADAGPDRPGQRDPVAERLAPPPADAPN